MEIKIKDQERYIDATIEVVDGVMEVSPKKGKFEPTLCDIYFHPAYYKGKFNAWKAIWTSCEFDFGISQKGWVFRTQEECEAFCQKLNQAINSIKP